MGGGKTGCVNKKSNRPTRIEKKVVSADSIFFHAPLGRAPLPAPHTAPPAAPDAAPRAAPHPMRCLCQAPTPLARCWDLLEDCNKVESKGDWFKGLMIKGGGLICARGEKSSQLALSFACASGNVDIVHDLKSFKSCT